jgi:hypothetical protein
MMNDEEFKAHMCKHMDQQTNFLETIARIAQTYEKRIEVFAGVAKFLKWAVGAVLGGLGIFEFFIRGHK